MRARLAKNARQQRKVIGYCRVSTVDQAERGVSLDAQRARLEAWGIANDRSIDEIVIDDGESAKSLQRPGIARILDDLRAGRIEALVVLKLDRLTRSVRDLGELLDLFSKHGAALISVSEALDTASAAGRLVVNMLGAVAAWEREAIAERTSFALAHKRRSRRVYGEIPFGYLRKGNDLVPDTCEQNALREALRLDRAGSSFREIARHLTKLGVQPHRGKAWYASSVRAMLRSRIASELAA